MYKNIIIIICVILSLFLGFKSCKTTHVPYQIIKSKIDTQIVIKHDSVFQNRLKYITIQNAPRLGSCSNCDSIKVYNDTVLSNGSSVVIKDTLDKEGIEGRQVNFNIKEITIRDSIYFKQKETLHLFIGPNLYSNKVLGIQGQLQYKSLGIFGGLNSNLTGNIGIMIKLK